MEEFYRRLFEVIPGYVSVQARDFRIVAANLLFREHFGEGVGGHCYQVYKGRDEKCPVCPVEQTFADGRAHSSHEFVTARNAKGRHVIVNTMPVMDAAGEIEAVVELSTDITEVKLLQERFRMLFEEAPCYITVQARDLRIRESNRRFRHDFGEMIGEHCFRAYKHRTEPCVSCPVAKTFEEGRSQSSEEVVTATDGKLRNVLITTSPLRRANGDIEAVMEMSTDITALREVQSQLASLGMLVGSVAHGIKGLLSGLDGGLYLMDTGVAKDKPDRVARGQEMVRRNVDRIRALVLNLLYYAKDREVFLQDIDLPDLLTSVGNVITSRAKTMDVAVQVRAGPGTFSGDHDALHSVLINLVDNAIDACRVDAKQVPHEVELSGRVDGARTVFEVRDNGVGMDQETREKAFSLFFSSKGAEGTGLGLFIAHKIVVAHRGAIDIVSTPGVGTCFTVTLPTGSPGDAPGPKP